MDPRLREDDSTKNPASAGMTIKKYANSLHITGPTQGSRT